MAIAYADVSSAEHQARFDELGPQGWRVIALSVSGDLASPRYTATWMQRPGPAWRGVHDVPDDRYQETVTAMGAEGLTPVLVSASGLPGSIVFAATFQAGEPPWFARHGLRWGALTDPSTINNAMGRAYDEGFIARSVTTYGDPADPRFAGVWTRNTGRGWAWHWGDLDYYQRTFDALKDAGCHPSQVAVAPGMRLGVFTDDHIGRWWSNHDMSALDYTAAVAAAVDGLSPIAVQTTGGRYAATFAATDIPMPKSWRVDGPPIPAAPVLDGLFAGVMQEFGIRAGSVAVAKGGTTFLKRAYTWAEDDWPTTMTTTRFRIASVSKTFTAAAIQALADDHAFSLDDKVFAYLRLTSNVPHDPRADAITIRQCATSRSGLPHDFEGDVTFRDISLGLGRQATIRDLAAHIYTVPLSFAPGGTPPPNSDDGYSNSAFHLLGAVIEQASGMALVDYVNQRLALPLGIHDLAAGRTAVDGRLPGEVVGYDDPSVGTSQLDLTPGAVAAGVYGGRILLDSAPGTGGLVTTPASIARFIGTHAAWDIGPRLNSTRYGTFVGTSASATTNGDWDFSFATNREIANPIKDRLTDGIKQYLASHGGELRPFDADEHFPIRGVLLVGGFRTQGELNTMTHDDMRNTLIVELTNHSNQRDYQAFDNLTLAGMGAAMVYLRVTGSRDDATLRTMSADDHRNTVIVELDAQTGQGRALQAFSTLDLALIALGSDKAVRGQVPGLVSSWIRGVLLLGHFRTQRELDAMTHDDMRNTLIVELTNRTNQTNYQSYNDAQLEGAGAVLVTMRTVGIRDDATLRTMSADDMRNTLIVELDQQTGLGRALQGFSDLDLVRTVLGDRPPVHQP